MKYNPKICDLVTTYPKAQNIHPYQSPSTIQGSLQTQFPELKSCYLSAVTEMMTIDKIDRSITIISDYLAKNGGN
jgi:glycine cleavage system protein P-like pyridoxal-binding family